MNRHILNVPFIIDFIAQKIYNKYNNYVNISFIFDKNKITNYKDSPIDRGAETFLKLFNERVVL